ncbi:Toluene efflux pump outer membrane protein TtgI [Patescibacteria group bacterium]|nr:Toluene efflux pump outer membrane protein TtgI [Patescibacteria group bacterium]
MTMTISHSSYHLFLTNFVLFSVLGLSACTVGTDFVEPIAPSTPQYSHESLPESVKFNKEMPALWWQVFHSPELDALIKKALTHSPDLQAAGATLTQARELAAVKEGDFYPAIDASFSNSRLKTSGAQFGRPDMAGTLFSLYNASINVSYTLDVFGGIERQVESLLAEADYQKFQLEGAFLTLSSNIVLTAITEAALREQISVTELAIKARVEQLDIVKQQQTLGSATQVEVLAQQTALEQQKSSLPILQKQLQQTRHRLAVLVGDEPNKEPTAQFTLKNLSLPKELPVSLPSKLVKQRPDIRAQIALLHAANAKIGAATAKMFPDFTITADLGSIASKAADWFMPGSAIWSAGNKLLQPLFHGNANLRQRDAMIAAYQAADAHYQSTVLQGLQNVADVLTAVKHDGDALTIQNATVDSAKASLDLAKTQYQTGATSYLAVLNAENAYQQARIEQVKTQALQLSNAASLFAALGGGWWQRPELPAQPIKSIPIMEFK